MVVDSFLFNGEYDLLEIRLNVLDGYVDRFIIGEGAVTFTGLPKPFYFEAQAERYKKWWNKIAYVQIEEDLVDPTILNVMESKDYVPKDQPNYRRAFYQKEALKRGMTDLDDEDIVYYGDADEIWKPQTIDGKSYKLRQLAYSYYLNTRSSEDWRGTVVTRYKNLRTGCLNDLRANPEHILENGGWHFTNMGGVDEILRKLSSYDHSHEVNTQQVRDSLQTNMDAGRDYLFRDFKMWVEEEQLPQYILDNKEKYIHLWKS